ncbi:2-hydroxyacid dehydrogenase [Stappia sp. GBMRC 2046]|uniref:2-hydroxyacid dehydrogenase n=1 Tax=Stappia sediminis TaxID=2692190 RepID=A0A7X3LSG8_9HYPH|nr:2-hydroxyacid dehydrogenase [Stappia sediminis]MXN64248.1 2-hydroxyacid dehydrogenase [Stappia sediminis]
MAGHQLIAIGSYFEWDREAMSSEYALHEVPNADAALDLPAELRAQVRAIAFKGHTPFGEKHMESLPALGLIANYGVGFDAIDIATASMRNIKVSNTPDVLNDDVADLAVALLLAQSRKLIEGSTWVRSGEWPNKGELPLNRKASGRRAGIVGLGRIGREIADRLAAFKMAIHYHSRKPKDTPPSWTYHADPVSMARDVDYLFIALVGGKETAGYVSKEVIEALGPDGLLINISRGSTIDEPALLEALENGTIRGAGLDVFNNEPNIDPRFLKLDNVVLQPHQGSGTIETRKAMGKLQRDNLAAFFAGDELITPVN